MLLLLALPAFATCETFYDDALTDGASDGDAWGGSYAGDGWWPDGGTMVYNFPFPAASGSFEITLGGLEESGLSQNDVAEMFTAHDGSFSDGLTHSFLQLKMAGDVYDGYAGRIKMQVGGEYGDMELAQWSDERDWNPADTHTISVTWGEGYAWMEHDGRVVAEVDYRAYNGGYVPFETLRIPNDGRYAYDPAADQLHYRHVWVCGEAGALPDPPTIDAFDVSPRDVALYQAFTVSWSVGGELTGLTACGQARATGQLACTPLDGASGSLVVGSEVLTVDTWDVRIEAAGPGGSVTSSPIALTIHEQGWTPSDDGGDSGGGDSGTDGGGDSGGGGGGTDSGGGGGVDSGDGADADDDALEPELADDKELGVCSCATGGAGVGWVGLAAAALLLRRRGLPPGAAPR